MGIEISLSGIGFIGRQNAMQLMQDFWMPQKFC